MRTPIDRRPCRSYAEAILHRIKQKNGADAHSKPEIAETRSESAVAKKESSDKP